MKACVGHFRRSASENERPRLDYEAIAVPAHDRFVAGQIELHRDTLSAIEHVVAEVLHLEDRGVGPAGRRLVQVRLDHLADDDVMVALLDDGGHPARPA
jgi:hypothetical protein